MIKPVHSRLSESDQMILSSLTQSSDLVRSGRSKFSDFEVVYFSSISRVEDIELRQHLFDEYHDLKSKFD